MLTDRRRQGLRAVLSARRRELGSRLTAAGLVTLCCTGAVGAGAASAWSILYLLLQLAELRLFWSDRSTMKDLTDARYVQVLTTMFLNSMLFGAFALLAMARPGLWIFVFASYGIGGAIIHTVITTTSSRHAFAASIIPYLFYLGLMPVILWIKHWPTDAVAGVAFGGVTLAIAITKLWFQAATVYEAQRTTEHELEQALVSAKAASKVKSSFLATMSHEIRTPLNGILGMSQAMTAGELSAPQAERLNIIHESGVALLAILNDLLDLSKIEAGKLELEIIDFDLCDVVRGAHSTFTELANRKGVSFTLTMTPGTDGRYLGDPTRLRQVLYNLTSNALKFTESGRVDVRLNQSDGQLKVSVSDTGIGIPADRIETLFDSFAQVDTSITRRFGGTGLGLSIVRELVHKMGGRLTVDSTLGVGSCFAFAVAIPRVGDTIVKEAPPEPEAPDMAAVPLRILVAEDNSINQLVLRALLQQLNVEPLIVENGRLALEAWERADWDVVLMDVHMPEMDGITAMRRIRDVERATHRPRTPIIALTANVMAHQIADYLAAGVDDVVAKPLEASKLFASLETVLSVAPDQMEATAAA